LHRDFAFAPGATTVSTPVDEVLERRAGVCQDFAHVTIAGLRGLGLAARYVSGYLETLPPEGAERLVGADVSHAWVSVFVPGVGWIDLDPTNDQFVNDRYVTVAWGRDYTDVPPLKGVIFTESDAQDLEVTVDVVPVAEDDPDLVVVAR
jgi:transglutaminase-like putative cysteine protease